MRTERYLVSAILTPDISTRATFAKFAPENLSPSSEPRPGPIYLQAPDALVENRLGALHSHRLVSLLGLVGKFVRLDRDTGLAICSYFSGTYRGRQTLAELWSCSPKAVSKTLASFRSAGVNVSTGYRGFRHCLTLEYSATTDAQLPLALADLDPSEGSAVSLYVIGSASSALGEARTVKAQAEALGISEKTAKRARAALRALDLMGTDGRVVRVKRSETNETESQNPRGHERGNPRGHERGKRYRELPERATPIGLSGSLPPNRLSENESTHETATDAQAESETIGRGSESKKLTGTQAREARRALDLMLDDAGPAIESQATRRALLLIVAKLAQGETPEELAVAYGGSIRTTNDPVGVIAHRLEHNVRQDGRATLLSFSVSDLPPERPPVVHVPDMSEDQMRELLTPEELAAIGEPSAARPDPETNRKGIAQARHSLNRGGRL